MKCLFSKMSEINKFKPIVVVLGATGTGKTKLSLEIASKYDGEIVNADSMQIYKGLDIVTNKVTPEERSAIPHHLLDFLNPLDNYNVVDFRDAALPLIRKLHDSGKLPVIVGGTHYYVESILWNVLIQRNSEKFSDISENVSVNSVKSSCESEIIKLFCNEGDKSNKVNEVISDEVLVNKESLSLVSSNEKDDDKSVSKSVVKCDEEDISYESLKYRNLDNVSNEKLLRMLEKVDPEIASTYHPNNRRKIIRSLEVWAQTGVRHSEHLRRQSAEVGGAALGGRVRFPHAAILWVTCDQGVLDTRLDGRVEQMLEAGLLQELKDFHALYNAPRLSQTPPEEKGDSPTTTGTCASGADELYTRGIFQAIGFKEFHDYLLLPPPQQTTEEGRRLYEEGVQMMKLRTRQYSRRQIKWIRNRFLRRDRQRIPVYAVDATDPSVWSQNVSPIVEEVVRAILGGKIPKTPPVTLEQTDYLSAKGDKTRHYCETCNRVFIGTSQWEEHLKSQKHRKLLKRKERAEKDEEERKTSKVS